MCFEISNLFYSVLSEILSTTADLRVSNFLPFAAVALFRWALGLISTNAVQVFVVYKMVRRYLGKRFLLVSKHPEQYSQNANFCRFFSESQRF